MSWKSKLKSAAFWTGKYVLTLGAGYLIERHVKNKTVKDLLNAAIKQAPVEKPLQKSIDKYLRDQGPMFQEEMAKMQDQIGSLLRRNSGLSQQAADARDKALK